MNTNPAHETLLARLLAPKTTPELRTLRREINDAIQGHSEALAQLRRDLSQIDAVIAERTGSRSSKVGGTPPRRPRTASRNGQPSLREVLLTMFREDPKPRHRDDILSELERRGALPGGRKPKNTLNSRLLEMSGRGELIAYGGGVYGPAMTAEALPASRNEEEVPIER